MTFLKEELFRKDKPDDHDKPGKPDKSDLIDNTAVVLDVAAHRRILTFLNAAVRAEDLMFEKEAPPMLEHGGVLDEHPDLHGGRKRRQILDFDAAQRILEARDREYPLGFRNLRELVGLRISRRVLDILLQYFSNATFGSWSAFPQPIPRREPGGYDGVVHAALLHTGQILFITADETTLLWNPNDTTPATFEDPVNQPQTTPNATEGYSVLCGGHSFLSDGRLLVVGGGGYGPHFKAKWGYKFDPVAKSWSRTAGSMPHDRWYPTVITLGDQRLHTNGHEVLVVCGHGSGDMEIYDEGTDSFIEITAGDVKPFPSLYPGLHLLPNSVIFYSRTGWGNAGAGGGTFPADDQSGYFALTGADTGVWTDIAPIPPGTPDRTKGMSVMLLSSTPPYVRVMVIGGSDNGTNNTYEIIDATALSSATNWGASLPFPDSEHRSLASAVLLPNGNVFVCGGINRTNSPCAMFNPQTNTWSAMAALPSIRDYHSVALLLPSGQVMMAGWLNQTIEIFNPPYMFAGPRPVISTAPPLVHHGQTFDIDSPDAPSIAKVVLVRPMAVTHQTDTEQKSAGDGGYAHQPHETDHDRTARRPPALNRAAGLLHDVRGQRQRGAVRREMDLPALS